MTEHTLYTLWILLSGKPGSARNYRLIRSMTPFEAYHATRTELLSFLNEKDAAYYLNKDLTSAEKVLDLCKEKKMGIICYHDENYPPQLREIEDPPLALFYYGNFPRKEVPTLGIVGTRKCSNQAEGIAAGFSCSLALSGFQIISGMADGIDTYAHKGSLIRGNPSFAVLGCGADVIYPKKNKELYELLKQHGGLLSEYLPGTPPIASNFPRRNRIISGLSDGILVVECPQKSGCMSTARYAVEQNRTLFAVPAAPNDRINTGTNQLIKHGAVFCTEPNDIFQEFLPRYGDRIQPKTVRFKSVTNLSSESENPSTSEKSETVKSTRRGPRTESKRFSPPPTLSAEETKVYQAFSENEILSADEISQRTQIPFHRLLPLLQALEMIGCIKPLPGALFRRNE